MHRAYYSIGQRTGRVLLRRTGKLAAPRYLTAVRAGSLRRFSAPSSNDGGVFVHQETIKEENQSLDTSKLRDKQNPVKLESCGDEVDDDDEMEKEEMFVDAYETFAFKTREWGGPRRGGRLPEPTRYGDWERKGRCSDF